LSYGPVNL